LVSKFPLEEKYAIFNKKHHVNFVDFCVENADFVLRTRLNARNQRNSQQQIRPQKGGVKITTIKEIREEKKSTEREDIKIVLCCFGLQVYFECKVCNFSKKLLDEVKFVYKDNLTLGIMVFQFHLRGNNLEFHSISNLLLHNNFYMNENQIIFLNFFFNSQLKSSI